MGERTALATADDPSRYLQERRRWRRRSEGTRGVSTAPRRRTARLAAAVLSVGVVALAGARLSASEDAFAERLSQGCDDVGACQQLEAVAARRLQACWLGCGSETAEHRMARSLRYRAEERSAVRAHYRERAAAERSEQQVERERQLADWQREQAAHQAEAQREQSERLELERLRQDRIDRRIQEERQRRVAYLALLEPAARQQRLQHCHAEKADCEQLVLDLVEAAPSAEEKHELAELNEQLLHPAPRRSPPLRAPAPNS